MASDHLDAAENLVDKADQMALGSAADVISLASAHATIALAEQIGNLVAMVRDFHDEEFGEEETTP